MVPQEKFLNASNDVWVRLQRRSNFPTQVFERLRCEDGRGANEECFSKSLPQFKGRIIHSFQDTRCFYANSARHEQNEKNQTGRRQ